MPLPPGACTGRRRSLPLYRLHGESHLLAAVTPDAAEGVAGEAFAVDADEYGGIAGNLPLDEGHVLVRVDLAAVGDGCELPYAVGAWPRPRAR